MLYPFFLMTITIYSHTEFNLDFNFISSVCPVTGVLFAQVSIASKLAIF